MEGSCLRSIPKRSVSPRTAAIEAFSVRQNNKLPGGIAHTIGAYVIETRNLEALIKIREELELMYGTVTPDIAVTMPRYNDIIPDTEWYFDELRESQEYITELIDDELSEELAQQLRADLEHHYSLTSTLEDFEDNFEFPDNEWFIEQLRLIDRLIKQTDRKLSTAPDVKHIWGVSPPHSSGEGRTRRRHKRVRSTKRRKKSTRKKSARKKSRRKRSRH